jgi:hypothetical protein
MVLKTRDDIAAVEMKAQRPKFPFLSYTMLVVARESARTSSNHQKQNVNGVNQTSLYAHRKQFSQASQIFRSQDSHFV